MPPKAKFTREEIVGVGLDVVRKKGAQGLTARALAASLGSSACPIFTLFSGMDEVLKEVLAASARLYDSYIEKGLQSKTYPPYKASGMAYIQFAREEKELFKLLFMRDRTGETIEENRESVRPMLDVLQAKWGISEDEAYRLHLEMWLYVHGVATMAATNYLLWDEEFISDALTDAYKGLCARFKER